MLVTGQPPAPRLRRDITLALVAKVAALFVLWFFFFSPAHRPPADTSRHIAGVP